MTKTEMEELISDLSEQLDARQKTINMQNEKLQALNELQDLRARAKRYEEVIDQLVCMVDLVRYSR